MSKGVQSFGLVLACLSMTSAVSTIDLGSAGNYVILAKSGITTVGMTVVEGNLGVSPAAATSITGFNLRISADKTFSTSSLVTGVIHAADYTPPTPMVLTNAVSDMEAAYNDAAGRSNPSSMNLLGGKLSNVMLSPGVHLWTTPVTMGGTITIVGASTDIFIFQISGTLDFSSGSQIILKGAQSKNIFYQVAGHVTLGSSAAVQGVILGKTGISFGPGASLDTGKALAQTAVTLIGNNIKNPHPMMC